MTNARNLVVVNEKPSADRPLDRPKGGSNVVRDEFP